MAYDPIQDLERRVQRVQNRGENNDFETATLTDPNRTGLYGYETAGFGLGREIELGYKFDPFRALSQGIRTGQYNIRSNRKGMQAALVSGFGGDQRVVDDLVHSAAMDRVAARGVAYVDSAAEFHRFLDARKDGKLDAEAFLNAAFAFQGEVIPSAAATITAALVGAGLGALTIRGGAQALAALGPVGLTTARVFGGGLARSIAARGITKKMVSDAVQAVAKKQTLTKNQGLVLDAVYKKFRSDVAKRRMRNFAIGGAGAQEYSQGVGTFFQNFAEYGDTSGSAAGKSFGLAVPFAAAGLAPELVVANTIAKIMGRQGATNILTKAGRENAKNLGINRRIATATVLGSQAEGVAEAVQQGLEVGQRKFIIGDDKYSNEQMKLDLLTSYFAGSVGGFGISAAGSSAAGVVAKANSILDQHHQKQSVADMYEQKFGSPFQSQPEPAAWLDKQYKKMMNPSNPRNVFFVDAASYSELNKMDSLADLQKNIKEGKLTVFEYGTNDPNIPIGGLFVSTVPENTKSFQQILELNKPSQKLIDDALAQFLQYPRSRKNTDAWVAEARDKEGNVVDYHQTSNPVEDGNRHLEKLKEDFKNDPTVTEFEVVDAETHLEKRAEALGPIISERNIIDEGFQEDARFEPPTKTNDPVILTRNKTPWTAPNEEFAEQTPNQELIDDARLATHPDHRPEFDEGIRTKQYSRNLLTEFVKRSDLDFERGKTYKIEKEGNGYGIATYEVDPNSRSEGFQDIKRDLDSIIRSAKGRQGARNSRFQIATKDGAARPVDMPYMVNQFRNLLKRTGLMSEGLNNYQELADAFTTLYGSITDDTDQTLTFEFNEITDEVLNNENAVVYTEDGGKKTFTLQQLLDAKEEQPLSAFEERVLEETGVNPRNENALRQALETETNKAKRELLEQALAQGTFDPTTDLGPQETDPLGGQEGDPIFNEMLPEDYWNAEQQSYQKQPLNKGLKRGRYKAASTGQPITISQDFVQSFGENRTLIEKMVESAKKELKITKEIKIFTTREQETIDVGDENLNKVLQERQKVINDSPTIKGQNLEFRDFDVILLKVGIDPDLDIQGLYYKRIGHEIGHSFLRTELGKTLGNPPLRNQLMKSFDRDRIANPTIGQYQGPEGMIEWYSDKIGAILFDKQKGKVFQAKNLSDSFLRRVANRIEAFEKSTRQHMQGQQNRFAFDETFAEKLNGILEATKEPNPRENDIGYEERAHIEEMLDQVFGTKVGEKTFRKINKEAEKILKNGKLPKWFKKLFYDAHSYTSNLGKADGTGKEIADMLHTTSGTIGQVGFINEANRLTNELINNLVGILRDKSDINLLTGTEKSFTQEEIAIFKEAADERKTNEQLSPKARQIREFLSDIFDRLDLAKYGVTKRENFFPRIIAVADIASNSKKRARIIELLAEKNNIPVEEATKVIEEVIRNYEKNPELAGEKDFEVGMFKERAALFEALDTAQLIDEELALPAEIAILEYIRDATRRSELGKRGGAARLKELVSRLPAEEQPLAEEAIDAMMGRINPIKNDIWRLVTNGGLLLNVTTLLSMAVFASIPDAAGPILRTRNFELKNIVKNLYQALGQKEGADLAKSFGANAHEAAATTILYAGEMDSLDRFGRIVSNGFFRYTQLERWTVFTRKFAAGMGRDFLLKHAKIVKEGYEGDIDVRLSIRFLKELGVSADEILEWNGGNLDNFANVKTALGRFVDESIVRPNAAERPIWASDPHFALVWQLKSFYYAYGKNIVGGLFREGRARYAEQDAIAPSVMPMLFGAALLAPLTMLGWDLRERFKIGLSWLLPGVSPNDPGVNYRASRQMSGGEYWFEVLDRSGYLGPYALAMPLFLENKRYGNPFFVPILGPSAEKAWNLFTGDFDGFDYLPGYSQLDTRNFGR